MAYSDPPPEDFGARLKRLAKERGLSNKALAEKTGAHETTVSRWMGGQAPRGVTLVVLGEILDVTPAELIAVRKPRPASRFKGQRRTKKPEEKEG